MDGGRRFAWALAGVLALLAAGSACVDVGGERILEIRADGTLEGQVFLDRNGSLTQDPGDGPVAGVAIQLVPAGGRAPGVRLVSTATGQLTATGLPVGDYDVVVEPGTIPDSLRLIHVATSDVPLPSPVARVTATETATVRVVLSYPTVSARQARALTPGTRVFVEGVTLNAWTTYGDSTVHVADTSGVIRGTRVAQSAVSSGQRVRLLGTADIRNGQGTLTDGVVIPLGAGQVPPPVVVSTSVAASADQGRLDAFLARVEGAGILGSQTNTAGDVVLTVSDGSGLLEVVLDVHAGISAAPYLPGGQLSAMGLLVPSSGSPGQWQLKPRAATDLEVSFPTVTVAQARAMEAGRIVAVEGVALNAWVAFADSTVHLSDPTGTIRAVRVQPANVFAGDRVRMVGTIVFRDGQPTLSNATASILGPGVVPLAERLSTVRAASADGGRLDAALVRVLEAVVGDTSTVAGDRRLLADDGTGPLEILLDRDAGFQLGAMEPGAILDVTGLLVPLPGGSSWRLKPRAQSDVVIVGNAKATVSQVRSLPPGRIVVVEGVALNGWITFADSTVHVGDPTGAIRAVQVQPANIVAGHRVRMFGRTAIRDGQPVLTNVSPSILGQDVLPLAETVTTGTASHADGGRLDARLVRVFQARVQSVATIQGDTRLRVTDGSGLLDVLLDRDIAFQPALYPTNTVINVTGVLVPISGEGGWQLKPRSPADIVIVPGG